ncbi:MAG: DUF1579 domain-containing protein [Chlamydiae bacterium]|nr:DUF1579 domain-containing protein [Chlamydiota bacterium]
MAFILKKFRKKEKKMKMDPSQPAQESKGISENHWIMGGRFLSQSAKGESMGQPFEGMGITGYDNVRGEYTSIWIDNMGTGIENATAQYDPATKTFSEKGSCSSPITGDKDKHFRAEWKIVDKDHYTYEMYTSGPDGKEFKNIEISYTRA